MNQLKTANHANPRNPNKVTKREARLARRIQDYNIMMAGKADHGGVEQRKSTGGYHKPGALK